MLQQQSLALTTAIQVLRSNQTNPATTMMKTIMSIDFPSWDAEAATLTDFLIRSETMKQSFFFEAVD
jgi:hypothetical protein